MSAAFPYLKIHKTFNLNTKDFKIWYKIFHKVFFVTTKNIFAKEFYER